MDFCENDYIYYLFYYYYHIEHIWLTKYLTLAANVHTVLLLRAAVWSHRSEQLCEAALSCSLKWIHNDQSHALKSLIVINVFSVLKTVIVVASMYVTLSS